MWRVALSILVILMLMCSLPIGTLSAEVPEYANLNSGDVLSSSGNKCALAFLREGDELDD